MKLQTLSTILILAIAATALAGCTTGRSGDVAIYGEAQGGTREGGRITQAGSSTVLPLAELWAADFGAVRSEVVISVEGGGSGAGATKLCSGQVDIGDLSRTLKSGERDTCATNGITPEEWKVAFDGLSVVVAKDNDFVQDLSVEQLAQIFRKDGHATRWNQVDADFPDQPIHLCYPDSDSGTYEYFNEAILNKGQPRTGNGVQQSANDNDLVTCLDGDENAIGYFGYAYVITNGDKVRAVEVAGVAPNPTTIRDGTYTPLGRPIYMYTDGVPTGILHDYFVYAFHAEGGQALVDDVGYVPLDDATLASQNNRLGLNS